LHSTASKDALLAVAAHPSGLRTGAPNAEDPQSRTGTCISLREAVQNINDPAGVPCGQWSPPKIIC
jgi:hypothetical protein